MLFHLKTITLFLLLGIVHPSFICADEFEDAVKSINRRDYETAYKMIVPLAEKGQPAAQLVLGMMYFKGTGVEKNIIQSDKWLSYILPFIKRFLKKIERLMVRVDYI